MKRVDAGGVSVEAVSPEIHESAVVTGVLGEDVFVPRLGATHS